RQISLLPSGNLVRPIRRRHGARERLVISYLAIRENRMNGGNLVGNIGRHGRNGRTLLDMPEPQRFVHRDIGQSAAKGLDARGSWPDLLPAITFDFTA